LREEYTQFIAVIINYLENIIGLRISITKKEPPEWEALYIQG